MKISEFFSYFYIDRSNGGLVGYKSKEKIPEFFMEAALEKNIEVLPTSSNTYGKWFDGTRNPQTQVWDAIITEGRENELRNAVLAALNISKINLVAQRFFIFPPEGEVVDKEALAFAITRQFYEIAKGNGEADRIADKVYKPSALTFPIYAKRALNKYSKTKMPFTDDEERMLEDVYVCNTISSRSSNASRASRGAVHNIEDISLEKIKEYSHRTILIGNGGMGKSIMLNYLFINALKKHEESGILPLFAELREFKYGTKSIIDYLVESVKHFDNSFKESTLLKLLEQGKCQILLDGIDEIDPSDFSAFQKQLSELIDQYPANQYVMASRECEVARSASGFSKLYLQPFNDEKKIELIDKLLTLPEDESTKDEIKLFLQNKFIKEHCVFATNPMLLTFVVANHPIIKTFNGKQSLFYKRIYETIIYGHDKSKPDYSRVFHSVKDGEEFTTAFREFCAFSYLDKINEFDDFTFEKYYKKINKSSFENPHKFTKNSFQRDACATSCMLYEERSKLLYIDEGFQALLFAEQMMLGEMKDVIEIGNRLAKKKDEEFNSFDGFDYFMEMDQEKAESCFFLPLLSLIFKNRNDDDAFLAFLELCHSDIRYNTTDSVIRAKWKDKVKPDKKWPLNSSSNVIYSMILKTLNLNCEFILDCYPDNLDFSEFRKKTIYGEILDTEPIIKIKNVEIPGDVDIFESMAHPDKYLFENGKPSIIGYEYQLDISEIRKNTERYKSLIDLLKKTRELSSCFGKLKEYYTSLSKKYS